MMIMKYFKYTNILKSLSLYSEMEKEMKRIIMAYVEKAIIKHEEEGKKDFSFVNQEDEVSRYETIIKDTIILNDYDEDLYPYSVGDISLKYMEENRYKYLFVTAKKKNGDIVFSVYEKFWKSCEVSFERWYTFIDGEQSEEMTFEELADKMGLEYLFEQVLITFDPDILPKVERMLDLVRTEDDYFINTLTKSDLFEKKSSIEYDDFGFDQMESIEDTIEVERRFIIVCKKFYSQYKEFGDEGFHEYIKEYHSIEAPMPSYYLEPIVVSTELKPLLIDQLYIDTDGDYVVVRDYELLFKFKKEDFFKEIDHEYKSRNSWYKSDEYIKFIEEEKILCRKLYKELKEMIIILK